MSARGMVRGLPVLIANLEEYRVPGNKRLKKRG